MNVVKFCRQPNFANRAHASHLELLLKMLIEAFIYIIYEFIKYD